MERGSYNGFHVAVNFVHKFLLNSFLDCTMLTQLIALKHTVDMEK